MPKDDLLTKLTKAADSGKAVTLSHDEAKSLLKLSQSRTSPETVTAANDRIDEVQSQLDDLIQQLPHSRELGQAMKLRIKLDRTKSNLPDNGA